MWISLQLIHIPTFLRLHWFIYTYITIIHKIILLNFSIWENRNPNNWQRATILTKSRRILLSNTRGGQITLKLPIYFAKLCAEGVQSATPPLQVSGLRDSKLCLKCKKSLDIKRFFLYQLYCWPMAPPAGLEPATSWLTVMRSANWAIEEYIYLYFFFSLSLIFVFLSFVSLFFFSFLCFRFSL